MLKRNWLHALAVMACALTLTACGGSDDNECTTTSDCKGTPPSGQVYQCINNTCQLRPVPTPTCSPECASNEVCDGSSGTGVCKTCTATQGCTSPLVCDTAANGGKGVCRACSDTSNNGTDQGCSAAAPVCDPAGNNGVGVCKACQDTASGGAVDSGCSVSTPMCNPAANNGAGLCTACVDSAEGNGQDLGCSTSSPVCDPTSASGVGACKTCLDSATGTDTDTGCTAAAPLCNTSANGGRGVCTACRDTATGTGTDSGCADTAPICDPTANNGAGACKSCVDSATGTGTDTGCGATTPLCDATGNNGAGACKACLDNATGTGTDLGCTSLAALCDPAAASGVGACRACLNTSSSSADLGCSAPTDICDTAANNSVGACKVCLGDNEGCSGNQTCNAAGTACEGCADDSECSNPSTPVCKPPPPVSICVECTTNANCAATRPVCDSATNFCGCTSDEQCASAPGNTDYCDTTVNNSRGQCTECLTDAHCAGNPSRKFCDNRMACIQCRGNADCSVGQVCNASKSCQADPAVDPAATSAQIQAFLDAPVGTLTPPLTISNGFVTYIKPLVGTDDAGFFVQAQPDGPAMFVAVDATTHQLQVGDRITFSVGAVTALSGGLEAATSITNLTIGSRGHPVQNLNTATPAGLAADRSSASDLQTNVIAGYESELVRLTGTIASALNASGTGHVGYNITTAGMTTAAGTFRLRVPDTFPDALDIVQTCNFTLKAGPVWRFTSGTTPVNQSQPSAYYVSDLTFFGCPAPKVLTAAARSLTQVVLTFDRRIDPSTVLSNGSQFTFSNGLTASAVQVTARQISLTTSEQTAGADYTVTVADTVKDLNGTGVAAPTNTATFRGYRVPATLRISEVGPTMASNADMVELVAVTAGTVDGFLLQQDINSPVTLSTFPNASVAAGDIIVVHIAPPAGYASETTGKAQFPASATPINYDTAWDFAGGTTGITYSSRLIVLKDSAGTIQDAVPFANTTGTPPAAFVGNLQALQAAGQWLPADCGGNPCTFTTVPSALDVAADWTGLPSSNADRTSNTVRRITANDTNMRADWGVGAPTWGAPNP
ncbi:Ig-like domain-containing protein [Hyalangium minutum]|uniref:Uncharacterized protein n=1 Tax=Hyalangium minutum TaxID=394096 RepID=A0A085WET5_9BACT|nr:Ig-like domain-containing protein [Hyalangium minutum]KFE66198.1 hypothetical protein DB31_1263 [Hyalangium minutum]